MVKPIRDKVLIKVVAEEKPKSLIIIPDNVLEQSVLNFGEVIDFGKDVAEKGDIKKGDMVWYSETGYEMNWDMELYAIVRDCHVAMIKG